MKHNRFGLLATVAMAVILSGGAAAAQDAREAELDALIDATDTDEGALAAARAQVAAGDLTGAAATLERSLLQRSGTWSDDVRLYYGSVLCRLGDYRRGVYQLSNVRNIAAQGWAEAREACGETPLVTVATRGNGVAGMFTLGVASESDAFGSLTAQFDFPPFVSTHSGVGLVGTAVVNAQFMSSLTGHGYAGFALKGRTDLSGPDTDYGLGAVWLGYARHLSGADRQLSGGAVARHAILFGDDLLTEYGGQAEYSFADGGSGRWILGAEAVHQDFVEDTTESLRDGPHYEVSLAYRSTPGIARAWIVGAAYEFKEAEQEFYDYRGGRVFAAAQYPITEAGSYIGASGVVRYAQFPDSFTFDHEKRLFLRAVVGTPLDDNGLFLEGALTYSGRWYEEEYMFDYESFGVETRLVYRFGL